MTIDAIAENEFWQCMQTGYEKLRDDQKAWAEVLAERAGEESALADGGERQ